MLIGIVAGETSGDHLGAGLVAKIKKQHPQAQFFGIGGPRMRALGVESIVPMDTITVMGLEELFSKLYNVLKTRRTLLKRFNELKPDVFVGVDVPDFNLWLEERLRVAGIPTVHLVSPTVWAWRGYRVHRIRRAVSHMLALFPFEADYFRDNNVPVTFIGHPLAADIEQGDEKKTIRERMGIAVDTSVLAILPGSRSSEIKRLGPVFIETAGVLKKQNPNLKLLIPCASAEIKNQLEKIIDPALTITLCDGQSREVMIASDVVLLASGTAALEAALLQRPMVVAYKVSMATYLLVKLFGHVDFYSMPNHLVTPSVVPEFIQNNAVSKRIVPAVTDLLERPDLRREISSKFSEIHKTLKQPTIAMAAEIVLKLAHKRSG